MKAVWRLAAVLLLALSAFQAAYALSPLLASQCACDHPADVPCDCPHHHGGDDEKAPPCHRHHHAMKAASSAPAKGSAFRNNCGARPPLLLLATQAPLPMPLVQPLPHRVLEPRPVPIFQPVRRSLPPERRPPRATV